MFLFCTCMSIKSELMYILYTGCSLNIVFFTIFLKIFRTLFSFGVSVCTHTRQVETKRCIRTGRVQKNHKILRKNTIFNEHPVDLNLHYIHLSSKQIELQGNQCFFLATYMVSRIRCTIGWIIWANRVRNTVQAVIEWMNIMYTRSWDDTLRSKISAVDYSPISSSSNFLKIVNVKKVIKNNIYAHCKRFLL